MFSIIFAASARVARQ